MGNQGQSAAEIVFDQATKAYKGAPVPAVDGLSMTVPAGQICVLLGPSGSGKTTALTMVNRLVELTSGDIRIDGVSVREQEPTGLRRRIGYVIQQIGLFPHMTIEENVATVPQVLGWKRDRIRDRVRELLDLVGLPPGEYGGRYPAQLSGGQRQRVGIARALAADPPVMLMDEPFGALDPITRAHMQDEFLRLHEQVRKTTLFVSHDMDEAVKMGDRIAILRQGGHLVQYDSPARILTAPADDFVARFVGTDRGLKALTLRRLGDLPLDPADAARDVEAAPLAAAETLHTALSALMASGSDRLPVADADGRVIGTVTLDLIRVEAGRPAPGKVEEPDAGPAASLSASAEGEVA
ncbi:MAG TPA: ABC transporter ATP-binding protein [Actinoallomurus sp.]|nr:ABC transporter ATP-binding protein [Actinoallomurus sp.]